jgi:hypothetical protein
VCVGRGRGRERWQDQCWNGAPCERPSFNVEIHVSELGWEWTYIHMCRLPKHTNIHMCRLSKHTYIHMCRLPKHTAERAARYSKDKTTKDTEVEKEAHEDEESGPQIGTSPQGKAGRGVWKPASERAKKEARKEGETSGGESLLWVVRVRERERVCL